MAILTSLIYNTNEIKEINIVQGQDLGTSFRVNVKTYGGYEIEKISISGIRDTDEIVAIKPPHASITTNNTYFTGFLSFKKPTTQIEIQCKLNGTPVETPTQPPDVKYYAILKEITLSRDNILNLKLNDQLEQGIASLVNIESLIPLKQVLIRQMGVKDILLASPSTNQELFTNDNKSFNYWYTPEKKTSSFNISISSQTVMMFKLSDYQTPDTVNIVSGLGEFVHGSKIPIKITTNNSNIKIKRVMYKYSISEPNSIMLHDSLNGTNDELFLNRGEEYNFILNTSNYNSTTQMVLIVDTYIVETPPPDIEIPIELNMFTDIFVLDKDDYKLLMKEGNSFIDEEKNDRRNVFIYDIFLLPFNATSIYSNDDKEIYLGNVPSGIMTRYLTSNILNISLGNITVDKKYNNSLDYENTDCLINIPYFKKISLDSTKVIGFVLSIEYRIDLYTRYCTVNIYSSFNGSIIYSDSIKIGEDIPYVSENNPIRNNEKINDKVNNNISRAFVEVIRNKPYGNTSDYGKDDYIVNSLGEYTGYIEVDKINLESKASESEKEEIETLLKQGVIIKRG